MNALYVMCGFPASGKSTYLKSITTRDDQIVLSTDEFMFELTGREWHKPAEDTVWSHLKITARILLNHRYNVYIDDINLTIQDRAEWIELAKELGIPVNCKFINSSFTSCLDRNSDRVRKVPYEIMIRMKKEFIVPSLNEGFSNLFNYNNEGRKIQ